VAKERAIRVKTPAARQGAVVAIAGGPVPCERRIVRFPAQPVTLVAFDTAARDGRVADVEADAVLAVFRNAFDQAVPAAHEMKTDGAAPSGRVPGSCAVVMQRVIADRGILIPGIC
jgi:hypothetical protein